MASKIQRKYIRLGYSDSGSLRAQDIPYDAVLSVKDKVDTFASETYRAHVYSTSIQYGTMGSWHDVNLEFNGELSGISHNTSVNPQNIVFDNAGSFHVSVSMNVAALNNSDTFLARCVLNGAEAPGSYAERRIRYTDEIDTVIISFNIDVAATDVLKIQIRSKDVNNNARIYCKESIAVTSQTIGVSIKGISTVQKKGFLYRTTQQLASNSGWTDLQFNNHSGLSGILHDNVTNPENITLQTARTYSIILTMHVATDSNSDTFMARVIVDGTEAPGSYIERRIRYTNEVDTVVVVFQVKTIAADKVLKVQIRGKDVNNNAKVATIDNVASTNQVAAISIQGL